MTTRLDKPPQKLESKENSADVQRKLSALKKEIFGDGGDKEKMFLAAKRKVETFMSSAPDPSSVEDRELNAYHFETVNRGRNVKPHPKMVVAEIKTLRKDIKKQIDDCLCANPAKVLELQKKLNQWLIHYHEFNQKTRSFGPDISIVDPDQLEYVLKGTGMERNPREYPNIKEDGKLGPQTFAAITCIREMYRN